MRTKGLCGIFIYGGVQVWENKGMISVNLQAPKAWPIFQFSQGWLKRCLDAPATHQCLTVLGCLKAIKDRIMGTLLY